MKIKSCAGAPIEDIYAAFSGGFADYSVPIMISQDSFERRFFYLEGNDRTISYIAYEDGRPVGLALGGADYTDGVITMHCSALCVLPDYRGRGIAAELFSRLETAAPAGRYHLEVVAGNDKAIHFYRRRGYNITNDIRYYKAEDPRLRPGEIAVRRREVISFLRASGADSEQAGHVARQSTPQYISRIQNELFFSAEDDGGWLAVSRHGTVHWLFVKPELRGRGYAGALIAAAQRELQAHNFYASSAGNAQLERFLLNVGFEREALTVYEMTRDGMFDL